jgi:hypothetical protein
MVWVRRLFGFSAAYGLGLGVFEGLARGVDAIVRLFAPWDPGPLSRILSGPLQWAIPGAWILYFAIAAYANRELVVLPTPSVTSPDHRHPPL